MTILNNAITSIRLGLEDYQSGDNERATLSCTRNIYAGILLLFKHKLSAMSPPGSENALIKTRLKPVMQNGSISWVGDGKKTVDTHQIQTHFESLKIEVDWDKVKKIQKFRNDIEHYFPSLSASDSDVLISNAFVLIKDFIEEHLDSDPSDLLGEESWQMMTEVNEVYQQEKKRCNEALSQLEYPTITTINAINKYTCDSCGSDLITTTSSAGTCIADASFECRKCGEVFDTEKLVESAIGDYFFGEMYVAHSQGGEFPYEACPECGLSTLVVDEGLCAYCGEFLPENLSCRTCDQQIPISELDGSGLCGYCSHILFKNR